MNYTVLEVKIENIDDFILSRVVTPTGQISNHFMQDLKKLAYYSGEPVR